MRRVVLIGDPVEHSLSPAMHNAAFRSLGLDLTYETWRVPRDQLAEAMRALRADPYAGANVTIPHKELVLQMADGAGEEARRIGAANTLVRRGSSLHAENTDAFGFGAALAEHGVDVAGRAVLVLGAGGAARACVVEALRRGARIRIASRTRGRIAQLIAAVARGADVQATPWPSALEGYAIVVNATPLGLHGEDPLAGVTLAPPLMVFDLIPTAEETPLLGRARGAGCATIDGLVMLLHQAARSFELWTERPAPVEVMRGALPRRMRHAVPDRG